MMRVCFPFLLFLFCASTTYAQLGNTDDLFVWDVAVEPQTVEQGQPFQIEAKLSVAENHIVYQHMTQLSAEVPEGFQLGEPQYADPVVKVDPTDGKEKEVFIKDTMHKLSILATQDVEPGEYEINVKIGYQGCSQTVCYFPQDKEFPIKVTVTKSTGGAVSQEEIDFSQFKSNSLTAAATTEEDDFFAQGYLWTFLTVFAFGIATCLTPCVYPLIPITVSILGARESKSKLQAFSLAFTYVIGIVVMYSLLGFFAAKTGAIFGQFLSNPWVIGFIVTIFVAMGASMLGAFELSVPSSIQSKLTSMGGTGYGSAFFMGLVAGIIAAPCTGPVLVGILTYVATSGNSLLGITLLMTYAFGLGLLFLVIGTFSGLITKMPKSGSWMEGVKSLFGILLFAFALYYLKQVIDILNAPLDNSTMNYIIAIVLFGIGIAVGAVHLSYHTHSFNVRLRKTIGVAVCVFAMYLGIGSLTAVQAADIDWVYNLDEGLEIAKQQNKPVMIDFYADWCTVCKQIEAQTFAANEVSEELKRFIAIKVDLTDDTKENQEIMKLFNIRGLPQVTFFDSSGNRLEDKKVEEFINKDDFLKRIEDIE